MVPAIYVQLMSNRVKKEQNGPSVVTSPPFSPLSLESDVSWAAPGAASSTSAPVVMANTEAVRDAETTKEAPTPEPNAEPKSKAKAKAKASAKAEAKAEAAPKADPTPKRRVTGKRFAVAEGGEDNPDADAKPKKSRKV
jgi:hypothetical protein